MPPTRDRICWSAIPLPDPRPAVRLRGTRRGHQLVRIHHPLPSGRRGTLKGRRDRQGRLALEQCGRILQQLDTSTQSTVKVISPVFEKKEMLQRGSMISSIRVAMRKCTDEGGKVRKPGMQVDYMLSRCNVGLQIDLVWRLPSMTAARTSTTTMGGGACSNYIGFSMICLAWFLYCQT